MNKKIRNTILIVFGISIILISIIYVISTMKSNDFENIAEYVITFNSDGGNNISSQTIIEGGFVKKPENPTRDGYIFKYWSYNNLEYDFQNIIKENIELKAVWEEKDSWTVLWVVFSDIKTENYNAAITYDEFEKIKIIGDKYEDFIENIVPTLDIKITYIYETSPVTNISLYDTSFGPYIEKNNISSQLNKNNCNDYDSIIAVADMTTLRSQTSYAGLTWGWDYYSFVPFFRDLPLQDEYPWFEPYPEQAFVHEWIHQVEWWFDSLGYKVPNLHDNASYGFPTSNENGWGDWYNAYLSNNLKNGYSTGIDISWRDYSPTSNLKP